MRIPATEDLKLLRTTLEKISRRKTIKRKISVCGHRIPILVSPDAQLKYLKPGDSSFDKDLIDIVEKYISVDSNVWDIGANVGVFAFAAAAVARKGSVLAVEADVWLADLLRRTASFDEYSDQELAVVPVAISNSNAVASFMVAARGRASNALETASGTRSQMGGVREIQHVPTLTLDTLLDSFPEPDFIKIDIEGAEYMALQGATCLIAKVRPIFYIEVGRDSSALVIEKFEEADYAVFDGDGNSLDKNVATYNNIFFVPKEKMSTYQSCQ